MFPTTKKIRCRIDVCIEIGLLLVYQPELPVIITSPDGRSGSKIRVIFSY